MTACSWIWALLLAPFWAPFVALGLGMIAAMFGRDVF